VGLPEGVGGVDAFGLVARGHADVGDHRVGGETLDRLQQLGGRPHGSQDLHLAAHLEEPGGALPHQVVVLGDDDP